MNLSERSIRFLGRALCGDTSLLPYKTGPKLVDFFVDLGEDDQYGEGFPSRWKYTEDKIRKHNGTPLMKKIIEEFLDPREFLNNSYNIQSAVSEINEYLKFDGYEIKKIGEYYKIHDSKGMIVIAETTAELDHSFVKEQIEKCNRKIEEGDYSGAITNARSLVEAVLINIIEDHEGKEIKNDGKLDNLYKQVKKIMNLTVDSAVLPASVMQILSGLESITSGLAGLSNNSGDRHANKSKVYKHHAKLAVNAAMTLTDFLLDSKEYQADK